MTRKYVVLDKIKWQVVKNDGGNRFAYPLCPEHHLRLKPSPEKERNSYGTYVRRSDRTATKLKCAEGPHILEIPRRFDEEQQYVIDRIDAEIFAKTTYIYLDDVAIPVASEMLKDEDSPVWVKTKVTESKSGLRLLVWAGVRDAKNKTQLFVEPELKRLSFDQNDDHPLEVFAKVEAVFAEGVSTLIKKSEAKR